MSEIIDRIETNLAAILASHYGNTPPKELTVKLATRAVEIMVEPTVKSGLKCPFRQPHFRMAADAPCPVCGVTSGDSSAAIRAACVDP